MVIHGGKSYVSAPPAFSNDGKRLLICSASTVSVFSTSTGLLVSELEGHKALVTSVVVVPTTTNVLNYCWTSSIDGTVRYWDFSASELIKTVDVSLPVYSMVIPVRLSKQGDKDGKPANLFAYLSVGVTCERGDKSKQLHGQIRKCNITGGKLANLIIKETEQPEFLVGSPSGDFIGLQSKRTLNIWKVPSTDDNHAGLKKMKLHHTKKISAFAFHPTENIVAAGDVTGRILVWRGFGRRMLSGNEETKTKSSKFEDERPGVRGDDDADSCSTWHWHSSEVKFLSFSSDGANIYSGGNEGVLVLWQLDTGKKRFLPKIGSSLLYFTHSPDPALAALSCADNQVHVLKMPSMEIFKSIAGIKLPCSSTDMRDDVPCRYVFDHSAGLVALPTENYCIQFYSLLDNREISEVRICERNHQPSNEITVVVSLVALSCDGSMMCTVESRLPEDGIGGLVCLKFWACETHKKDFKLSTVVYEPHRDAAISAIAFHPERKMVVTSSYGGDFKIWVHNDVPHSKDRVRECIGWVCHSVGSYRDKPMTAATFSADGSVLAVAAETVITLWDPNGNYLVAVIGETYTPIVQLSFVGKSEYMVSISRGSRPQLSLWSMSELSRVWSYNLLVEAVACRDDDSTFAVLAPYPTSPASTKSHVFSNGVILLFNVTDPVPFATWLVGKANGGGIAFLRGNQLASSMQNNSSGEVPSALAYINCDHEYIVFDSNINDPQELKLSHKNNTTNPEETERSGYLSIYGELPQLDQKRTSQIPILPSERPWETIFSGPSHALPPLTKLCSAFLESLLEKRLVTTS